MHAGAFTPLSAKRSFQLTDAIFEPDMPESTAMDAEKQFVQQQYVLDFQSSSATQ